MAVITTLTIVISSSGNSPATSFSAQARKAGLQFVQDCAMQVGGSIGPGSDHGALGSVAENNVFTLTSSAVA